MGYSQLDVSADNRRVALSGVGALRVSDTGTGDVLWEQNAGAQTQGGEIYFDGPVRFTVDGRFVLAGGSEGGVPVVGVFDAESGRQARTLRCADSGSVIDMVPSTDGSLATLSWSGTIQWWDISTGEETHTRVATGRWKGGLAFNSDLTLVAYFGGGRAERQADGHYEPTFPGLVLARAADATELNRWNVRGLQGVRFSPRDRILAMAAGNEIRFLHF